MATVAILTKPLCAGGVQLCRVADFVSCTWHDVVQNDRGGCTLILPADSPAVAVASLLNIIRITDDPDALGNVGTYEFRITSIKDGAMLETVVLDAQDLSADLGRVQLSLTVGGLPSFTFSDTQTPSGFLTKYVLPALAAAGISWVAAGTITPTGLYTLSFDHTTPLALLTQLEQATLQEFWLSWNSDTNYLINLGRRSASGSPIAWVGRNVETLERNILADQYFYNRAMPYGATLAGEKQATHLGQHGWLLSTVAGGPTLTLAHPQAGGVAPIGADSQLNGLVAGVSFDAVGQDVRSGQTTPFGITYDQTRRTIWWTAVYADGTTRVFWHSLADGTSGNLSLAGIGSAVLYGIVYDATRDEVLVACNDVFKIARISAGAKTYTANFATTAKPTTLTDLNQFGINQLAVGFSTAAGLQLFNLSTLASVATLATTTPLNAWCIYDSGSTRYFVYGVGVAGVAYYSSAYANLGTIASGMSGGIFSAGLNSGTMYIVEAASAPRIGAITCSTAALSALTTIPNMPDGTAPSTAGGSASAALGVLPYLGSRLYIQASNTGRNYLFCVDPASSYAVSGATLAPSWYACYDPTDDVFVLATQDCGAAILYRNGGLVPSGRLRAAVQTSTLASQQITLPAGTKGPIIANQLAEFRTDASDTYDAFLEDPASVAAYGPLDAFPQFVAPYKRNYKRDPQCAEWASSRPMWLGLQWPIAPAAGTVGQPRWVKADAQVSARSTACTANGTQVMTTASTAVNISGLAAGRVVQCGDVILSGANAYLFATDRATADGSGNVTVPISCATSFTLTGASAMTILSPAQSDGLGIYMCALPIYQGSASNLWAPNLTVAVHAPKISGDALAWVRVHFFAAQANLNTNNVSLSFGGHLNNAVAALTGPSATAGTPSAPVWQDLVLEQQLALSQVDPNHISDDFLRIAMAAIGNVAGPTSAMSTAAYLALWVKSVEVYIASTTACPAPNGMIPGDELGLWIGANALLFGQTRSTPSFAYTVKFLQDGVGPQVGQTCTLRDPARGIAASPRIVRVDRSINRDSYVVNEPIVQLETRSQSAMEGLAQAGF